MPAGGKCWLFLLRTAEQQWQLHNRIYHLNQPENRTTYFQWNINFRQAKVKPFSGLMQKEGKKWGCPTKLKQLRIKGKIIAIMGSSGDEIHPT